MIAIMVYIGYVQTACKLSFGNASHIFWRIADQRAVFSALRIFAIWNQNYALSLCVLMLGLVPLGTNIVSPLTGV